MNVVLHVFDRRGQHAGSFVCSERAGDLAAKVCNAHRLTWRMTECSQ